MEDRHAFVCVCMCASVTVYVSVAGWRGNRDVEGAQTMLVRARGLMGDTGVCSQAMCDCGGRNAYVCRCRCAGGDAGLWGGLKDDDGGNSG